MRRTSWASICSAETGKPAGSPSTMTTRAFPCDSPAVAKRSRMPAPRKKRGPVRDRASQANPKPRRSRRWDSVSDDARGDEDDEVFAVLLGAGGAEEDSDQRQRGEQRDAGARLLPRR